MDLETLPGVLIPCADLQRLRELVGLLYKNEILTDESIKLVNVPADFKINQSNV